MARRKRNQKLKIFIIILVLCILGVVGYLVWANFFKPKKNNGEPVDIQNVATTNSSSNATNKDNPVFMETNGEKKVVQYDGEDPNKAEELTGVVTYAGISPDNDKLTVRVNIDQFLEGGKCIGYLYNTNNELLYENEVGIIDSVSTSTCQGFDFPLEGVGTGELQVVIKLESNGKTGKIIGKAEV